MGAFRSQRVAGFVASTKHFADRSRFAVGAALEARLPLMFGLIVAFS